MSRTLTRYRAFEAPIRLLMVQQFTINAAFYMLMPYLAAHLTHGLGLAAWAVGLVLGVRNLSQQGLFLIGGTLADRFGCKRVMLAGCLLRTLGFALLGLADTLTALVVASAATGFAGAMFNPAVRAYLADAAGEERRVEAFAVFNVFYQAGMFVGPLIGLALLAWDFRAVCAVAALLFAALTAAQYRALPDRPVARAQEAGLRGVLATWRAVAANRPFLLFSFAMTGSYVLSFQVYLALPLAAARTVPGHGDAVTTAVFAVSALVTVTAQFKVTSWAKRRWSARRAIGYGLVVLAAAFLPPLTGNHTALAGDPLTHWVEAVGPLLASAALIALATALIYPFEMDTVVSLASGRLVATHYGFYNTITGIGITVGNLATGALWDTAARAGHPRLPWLALATVGFLCAGGLGLLARTGRLSPGRDREEAPALVA